jgi:hypothetical protein
VSTQSYDSLVLADNPQTYWKMDEASGLVVADAKGVSPVSFPDATSLLRGQPAIAPGLGLSLKVSGTQKTAAGPGPAAIVNAPFSLEMWVAPSRAGYPNASLYDSWPSIFTAGLFDPAWTQTHYTDFGVGVTATLRADQPQPEALVGVNTLLAPVVTANMACHLVVVVDATNVAFYENGALLGTVAHGIVNPRGWGPGNTPRLLLGPADVNDCFQGRASNWALYTHALTAAQVQAHWDNAQTVYVPPPQGWTMALSATPAGGSVLTPGDALTYNLAVQNTGGTVLSGQTATLDLASPLKSATLGALPSGVTAAGSMLSWAIPAVALGASASVAIPLTVNAGAWEQTLTAIATAGPNGTPATAQVSHTTIAEPFTGAIRATPTVLTGLPPRVEVYIEGTALSGALTTLERVLPDGTATVVRGVRDYPTTGPIYVTDFEPPFYVDLRYRATATKGSTVEVSALSPPVRLEYNMGWLSDPLTPGSGVRVYVQDGGWHEQARSVGQDVFHPLGRPYPVAVSGVRHKPTYAIRLTSASDADTATIRAMLERAQPALLRLAEPRYGGWTGGYVALGEWKEQRWADTFSKRTRVFDVPCWEVESPTAGAVISLWTWGDVSANYAKWDNVRTSKDSWATLLRNPTPGPR